MQGVAVLHEVRDYAIYMLDPQGVVLTWNNGARAIKGYLAEEIVGQSFSRFFTAEDLAAGRPERLLHSAREQGRVEDQAWRLRKDGTRFWADVVITALHENGQVSGFLKVTRDLTERRVAEEMLRQSEERARLLIESVKDYAIFMLDPRGYILSWNAGAQRIKGYAAAEIIGQHFSIFYPLEVRRLEHPDRELRIARETGRYEEEGIRLRKSGERFWANVVITAVYEPSNGELRGFAKVTRDLTERRAAEEAMRLASEAISIERLRADEARNALKARDEFISVAAHELRTPLSALLLKVESARALLAKVPLSGDGAGALSKLSDRLNGALGQIGRLTGLIHRLLDASAIVRNSLALRVDAVSMRDLAQRAVADYQDAAETAGCVLTLKVQSSADGYWDELRLEQVIANLLSNAIKYGAGKPIEVRVEEVADTVRLVVIDHGIGIDASDTDRIFGRFERAVSLENYGGLGLGLYISQSIVDAHGGSIRVSSTPQQGSTFTVELPRSSAPYTSTVESSR